MSTRLLKNHLRLDGQCLGKQSQLLVYGSEVPDRVGRSSANDVDDCATSTQVTTEYTCVQGATRGGNSETWSCTPF